MCPIILKKVLGIRPGALVIPAADKPSPPPAPVVLDPPSSLIEWADEPPHLVLARSYIGVREIKGSKHNPKIIALRKAARTGIVNDEDPWCADFVNGVVEAAGFRSARTAGARATIKLGVKLDGPAVGAIAVLWRGSKDGWAGHTGFIVGRDRDGNLMVLGGNQSDAVNIKPFPRSRVLGYRWPAELALPKAIGWAALPVLKSDGRVSTNEA
jgi:uncharacterized protein (TIGR02594 family)